MELDLTVLRCVSCYAEWKVCMQPLVYRLGSYAEWHSEAVFGWPSRSSRSDVVAVALTKV